MNIDSSKINIYPAAVRDTDEAVLNTEYNITNSYKHILDNNTLKLSDGLNLNIYNNNLEISKGKFMVNGYMLDILNTTSFPLSDFTVSSTAANFVYLELEIDETGTSPYISETDSEDESGQSYYNGLEIKISQTKPNLDNCLLLGILVKDNEKYKIYNIDIKNRYSTDKTLFNPNLVGQGLDSGSTTNQLFSDWLENNFMLDDGIIESQPIEGVIS